MKILCFLFAFLSMSSFSLPNEIAIKSDDSKVPMKIVAESPPLIAGVITNHICSDGHPYYRFSISGSADSRYWYADHHHIFTSRTGSGIIAKSTSQGGFTVYCRITKGSEVRTAYYRSHTDDSCGSGTTGYL